MQHVSCDLILTGNHQFYVPAFCFPRFNAPSPNILRKHTRTVFSFNRLIFLQFHVSPKCTLHFPSQGYRIYPILHSKFPSQNLHFCQETMLKCNRNLKQKWHPAWHNHWHSCDICPTWCWRQLLHTGLMGTDVTHEFDSTQQQSTVCSNELHSVGQP
jgi:hypothetical protein